MAAPCPCWVQPRGTAGCPGRPPTTGLQPWAGAVVDRGLVWRPPVRRRALALLLVLCSRAAGELGPLRLVPLLAPLAPVALAPLALAEVAGPEPLEPLERPEVPQRPAWPPERRGAELVHTQRLPLRTKGRYIVDSSGERVKWACINWAGAYFPTHVAGGLDRQRVDRLAARIAEVGFNCVRLCYSTQGYTTNPVVDDEDLAANPVLQGGRHFLELFDATVKALTDVGLMVIINNHNSKSGWCCNVEQDEGLWYVPEYNESMWIASLVGLADRYRSNPLVVAFDLRNEPHDVRARQLTWGTGDPKSDWAAAAQRAGDAVLTASPDVLIVVSALCFSMELRPLLQHQVQLMYPNRVIYETHNYIEFQLATLISNNLMSWTELLRWCFVALAFLTVLLAVFLRVWADLGRPKPSSGAVVATATGWIAFALLVATGILGFCYHFYSLYCSYLAKAIFLPFLLTTGSLCLVSGAVALLAWRSRSRPAVVLAKVCLAEESEEESCSEERSSVFLPEESAPEFSTSGWTSCRLACEVLTRRRSSARAEAAHLRWDRGLCCGMQCFCFSVLLWLAVLGLIGAGVAGDSYLYMKWTFDTKWGFALSEGHPYTAPVWMGEFGQSRRGIYWMNVLRYLADRDVDFAYWALNGKKLIDGKFDNLGRWIKFDKPVWQDESFGLFEDDFFTIRDPWKLLDIQALMESPTTWHPVDYPCEREVLGNACGE